MRVEDIMSQQVISCTPETKIREVASVMKDRGVGFLPVLNDGVLAGVLTDRDLIQRFPEGADPDSVTAGDLMSRKVFTTHPKHSVVEASRYMASKRVRRLPVVEDGRIVGVVSLGDFARTNGLFAETAAAFCEICRSGSAD